MTDLEVSRAWIVDPVARREGPGEVVVRGGVLEALSWLSGTAAKAVSPNGVVIAPGFIDLHAHLRQPGNEDAETVASGLAAAAHGGFTVVCAMPNTTPALDERSVLDASRVAAILAGSPVRLLSIGAVTVGRSGTQLAALGELADGGVVGFSDDGSPIRSATILRAALAYAGALGLPIIDHAEDATATDGAEANDGFIATVLGLRGWPVAAEASAVGRDLAVLADVVRDEPGARLHLTHLSTAEALDLVRRAKAAGLPVTCDVTPHHLVLTDEWVAGARRWAWEASGDPWADEALVERPYATSTRVNPPLRAPDDAAACLAALLDGTADAIATDHAPHTVVDKAVEFGLAANGISGIETALGLVLAAVDAERLPLMDAIRALTVGPAGVLGKDMPRSTGFEVGSPADFVVFDRSDRWTVTEATLSSKGKNSPLLGMELGGRVLVTFADGRLAYEAPEA